MCRLLFGVFPVSFAARDGPIWKILQDGCSSGLQPKRVLQFPREVPGRWRQSKRATVASQVPKPRMSPDASHEKAQSSVARLEIALEAMGDVKGPAVEVLKAELIKAREAAKQLAVDLKIDQCRKFISRSERKIKELESQRASEVLALDEANTIVAIGSPAGTSRKGGLVSTGSRAPGGVGWQRSRDC